MSTAGAAEVAGQLSSRRGLERQFGVDVAMTHAQPHIPETPKHQIDRLEFTSPGPYASEIE